MDRLKIAVAGAGYVGFSLAVILSRSHDVTLVDVNPEKIILINQGKIPFSDQGMENFFAQNTLSLTAALDGEKAYSQADMIIIAVPTDYNPETKYFNTSSVESVLRIIKKVNPSATVVIKSTLPLGFTEKIARQMELPYLLFSPEFLREGRALQDNLHPSRIIAGMPGKSRNDLLQKADQYISIIRDCCEENNVPILKMHSTEAEAVKLFSNTYLAMRVAFFNELDSYSEQCGLNSSQIIKGMGLDPRIGTHYNLPSFGYGGYCLPKDSKQLLAEFSDVPNALIQAVVDSNEKRKEFIASRIIARKPNTVGVYRLTMKAESDNFRMSAVLDIMDLLYSSGIRIIIYEPLISGDSFQNFPLISDLKQFADQADIIIANRMTKELNEFCGKVYTRDNSMSDKTLFNGLK